jgi:aldose 1-epimerase
VAIGHGDQRVVIAEVGATLRSFTKDGVAVIQGFSADEYARGGRGQVLFPWPNRLGEGEWTFSGRVGKPAIDDSHQRTANHGLARWRPFTLDSFNQNRCAFSLTLYPSIAYPFLVALEVAYHLGALGLTVTSTVTNNDDVPVPVGLGFHPYLAVTTPTIEGTELTVPAAAYLTVDDRQLPTGEILPVFGGPKDFRVAKSVSGHTLDLTYTELVRDDSGLATAVVTDSSGGSVELTVDRTFSYLQVFTGDTLERGMRRTAIGVEPMTCPPEALRSGKDVVVLEPGQRWAGSWRVRRAS